MSLPIDGISKNKNDTKQPSDMTTLRDKLIKKQNNISSGYETKSNKMKAKNKKHCAINCYTSTVKLLYHDSCFKDMSKRS